MSFLSTTKATLSNTGQLRHDRFRWRADSCKKGSVLMTTLGSLRSSQFAFQKTFMHLDSIANTTRHRHLLLFICYIGGDGLLTRLGERSYSHNGCRRTRNSRRTHVRRDGNARLGILVAISPPVIAYAVRISHPLAPESARPGPPLHPWVEPE
jgi:hypothetical protein